MAAVSLFWDTNMAAVTSCENTPYGKLFFYWNPFICVCSEYYRVFPIQILMFRNQCYATMPMFTNAHISSLGYLRLDQANGDPAVVASLLMLRFVLSLCQQSEAVPPGFLQLPWIRWRITWRQRMDFSDSKLVLGTANGFWRLRISFRDSEYIFAIQRINCSNGE